MAKESTSGVMVDNTRESGKTTTCMAKECTLGKMVEGMRESILMIRSRAMEFTSGKMVEGMRANGSRASNMDMASTILRMPL